MNEKRQVPPIMCMYIHFFRNNPAVGKKNCEYAFIINFSFE